VSYAGTNPSTGVPLYYVLPAGKDSAKLTLEILDDKGVLVRRFSSTPNSKFTAFPGGPEQEPVLPNKPGLNRFVWDLRHPTLPGVPTVFIEGSYQGRKVAPGAFTARLKRGIEERATTFTVLPDPRLNAMATAYREQEQTLAEVDRAIKEMHDDVNRMKAVRKQVNDMLLCYRTLYGIKIFWKAAVSWQRTLPPGKKRLFSRRRRATMILSTS
jgi:hypothetical protein